MSDTALKVIRDHMRVLQEPMPLVGEPFARYAELLGVSQDEVIELLRHYRSIGVIRRVAGVLKHQRAGFTVNSMLAMVVDTNMCDAIGEKLARLPFITHCYRRTAYPDWPYTIYTMVHARSADEFDEHFAEIKNIVGSVEIAVLRSLKEYKKTAFRSV